jgi:DNA-binding transcriptional ArsR family regulator
VRTFEALADDTRTGIIAALADRPHSVSEIVSLFDVSQPAISQHLRVLRDAGLVSVQPAGRSRIYHLDPRPLAEVDRWLDRYRRFWATRLNALESHMEANPDD